MTALFCMTLALSQFGFSAPAEEVKYTAIYNGKSVSIFTVRGDWACDSQNENQCGFGNEETFIRDSTNKSIKSCNGFFVLKKSNDQICGLKLKNIVEVKN